MRHASLLLAVAVPAVFALSASPLSAQNGHERRVVEAVPLQGEIEVDGRLDEPAWQAAPVVTDFVQVRPNPGEPATERTEVRVLYDERNLYVGMRMYDSSPDRIAAQLGRRDATGLYSDWAHVVIDSYHDRRTAFRFSVNPRGVMRDVLHFDDRNEDGSWNAVWEVATSIDDGGWTAEYRIPLSQLRFETDGVGELVWGINFGRDIARKEERTAWNPMPPEAGGFVSLFGDLHGLRAVPAPRRLEVSPYLAARLTRAPMTHAADPFWRRNDPGSDVGVDLMYGLGSQLTLSATINPDFGQVEVDPAVVNLSAFPTFFPERRPFFLEGADIFRFGINVGDGGSETLFYTRRIGRAPQRGLSAYGGGFVDSPANTRILGATKLSGQTGPWSVGLMHSLTRAERATVYDTASGEFSEIPVEPLSNYAVGRLIRAYDDGRSRIGGMVTATHRSIGDERLRVLPAQAYVAGTDWRHRFGDGNHEVNAWMAGSHVVGDTLAIQRLQRAPGRYFQRPDAAHLEYDPARTSLSGVAANVNLSRVAGGNWRYGWIADLRTPGFEVNDLGFQHGADRFATGVYAGRIQFEPVGPFRSFALFTNIFSGWTLGGEREYTGYNLNGNFDLRNNWGGWGGFEHQPTVLSPGADRGGAALRTEPRTNYWGGINSDRRHAVYGTLAFDGSVEHGTDGHRYSVNPSVNYRPAPRLQMSLGPSYRRNLDAWQWVGPGIFARLDQTTVSMNTRLNVTFAPTLTLELFAQPFVSAGEFSGFMTVEDPRADRFEGRFAVGEQPAENPGFNIRSLRGNAVLRWEYRPGSTLFLVWQQERFGEADPVDFRFDRDVPELFRQPATNVLMLKATYWFGG